MPTGYTAVLGERDDVSLKEFVYMCSHAFIYDSSGVDAPKELEHSNYYTQKIKECVNELERINQLSNSEAKKEEMKEREHRDEEIKKYISDKKVLRKKYENMLHKVNEWIPPSDEHSGLKKFMIEQLNKSIDFDCNCDYHKRCKVLSGEEWISKKQQEVRKSLKYYEEEDVKEFERVEQHNNWIRQLKKCFED